MRRFIPMVFIPAVLLVVLGSPLSGQGSVTLPLADYLELVEKVEGLEGRTGGDAVAEVVEQHTAVTLNGETAEVVTILEVEVDGTPTRPVGLPLTGLATTAEVEPRKGASLHRDGGRVVLLAPEPGRYQVTVHARAPLASAAGVSKLELAASPAPVQSLKVDLPADREWTCAGATLVAEEEAGGRRRLELAPRRGAGHALETRRGFAGDEAERGLSRLTVVTVVEVDAHRLRRQEVVLYEVLRGELGRFELGLPPGLEVDRVATDEGDAVAVVEDDRLTVERRQRLTGGGHLLVSFRPVTLAGGVELDLRPVTPSAPPQARYLVASSPVAAALEPLPADAWRQVDLEDLPGRLAGEIGALEPNAVWRLDDEAASPRFKVAPLPAVESLGAVVRSRDTTTLWTVDGSLVHRDFLVVEGAETGLEVFLPAGATLWSASVDGQAVRPVERGGAMVVPLGFKRGGEVKVEVVAVEERAIESGRSRVRLVAPRVTEPVVRHEWRLLLPRGNRYRFASGDLRPAPRGAALEHLPLPPPLPPPPPPPPPLLSPPTSGLYGQVTDWEGATLPGVTVTIEETGFVQFTDAVGRFFFPRLHPGTYSVEFSLDGFSGAIYEGVQVHPGRATWIEAELAPTVEETITVTSQAPLLDSGAAARLERELSELEMQSAYESALDSLQGGLVGGVKPLEVAIPESGKVLFLTGALPPPEVAVEVEVKNK